MSHGIRCDLDRSQASMLEPPSGSPVIHLSDFNQTYQNVFGTSRYPRRRT